MTYADFAMALGAYYWIGTFWLAIGLLPPPFGWLDHKMPVGAAIIFVFCAGAVWPWVAFKIVRGLVHGQREIEL